MIRRLLAVVVFLMAPGPACWEAAAASIERPGGPGGAPIIPRIENVPGKLGAELTPLGELRVPDLAAQTQIPGAPVDPAAASLQPQAATPQAQRASPEAQSSEAQTPEAVVPAAAPTAQGQTELEKTLSPGAETSPEEISAAANLFEKRGPAAAGSESALTGARSNFLKKLVQATGLSPLLGKTSKLAVHQHAARLLDAQQPSGTRSESARRLGQISSRETIEALGETAAADRDPMVREAAREALVSMAPRWVPVLVKELNLNPLSGRRAAAARALGWIARFSDDAEVVDALARRAAVDLNHDVRLTAIDALGRAKSLKALVALVNLRRLATKPDIISASEVAIHRAIAVQQAAGVSVAPYHPAPGQFGSSKQPLYASALKKVIGVSAVFTAIEMIGGFMIGSLSLKADSMHLLADLGINAGALFALWMSRRPPNSHKTYGYLKMESLTGLLSAVAIAGMALWTLMEAVPRLWAPVAVPGLMTIALACSGLLSNAISTLLLYRYQDDNLSLKGAFLHAATDAIGSVGIITAGALIYFFHWFIADPIITFLIVALIVHTTWDLAKRSWNVLIDAVPPDVKIEELEADLLAVPGVASVYDLHVWSLNSSEKALTAVLYVKPNAGTEAALAAAKAVVAEKYKIGHATLQVEYLKPPTN